MTTYNPRKLQPVRRGLTDQRSTAASGPPHHKTLLNASRSTRA